MSWRHEEQKWLTSAPADFRDQCRKVATGAEIKSLAGTRLNANQLVTLSKTIEKLQNDGVRLSPLSNFHLGVLGNATTCLYVNALKGAAARYGVNLSTTQAEYDQVMQTALDPSAPIHTVGVDAVLLALDYHGLPFDAGAQAAIEYVKAIRDGLSAPIIYQTIVCPPEPQLGSLDASEDATLLKKVMEFNAALFELAAQQSDYVLDVSSLANMVGTQNWQDPAQWNLYKLPFSQNMMPVYVDHVARMLSAIRGLSKKCLVLDLDNTIWGGVIGDDGLNGIKIGQGDGVGEAHLDLQRTVLMLRDRGIILAVSSKNDDAVARQPFREHPDMLLKEKHISVFQANWKDKASNLEVIAKTLNIGLDALVFLDDNPVERAQVREVLPMVSVPELPADPSSFSRVLLNAGYFETVSFSTDDKKRAEQYSSNALRAELQTKARDMEQFLNSLNMKLEIGPFNDLNKGRVAQLINKTNQFNLTTRRYTENEVNEMMADTSVIKLQARLIDRFGDNGLITVAIGRVECEICTIDTWLMSCRVLGRRVEEAFLSAIVLEAQKLGAKTLEGLYVPSEKNTMVAEHYKKLGFSFVGVNANQTTWRLSVSDYTSSELPFSSIQHTALEN
jgi:FkbH-like protein